MRKNEGNCNWDRIHGRVSGVAGQVLFLDFGVGYNDVSHVGTSLVVKWLRLHAPNAGGPGLISGQRTRSCMLQLRAHMPLLKDPAYHN